MRAAAAGVPRKGRQDFINLFTLIVVMARKSLICLLALVLIQAAHADSVKDALNQKYKKHVFALRSPFLPGGQKFDADGHLIGPSPKGPWLTYGAMYFEKVTLSADALRLEGPRVVISRDKSGKPILIPLSKSLRIEIRLPQPLNSLDDADTILGRVFFIGADSTEHLKPEFRRADSISSDEPIYHVKKDNVLPPRATYTPEPEFSKEARQAKYQGMVVLSIVVDKLGTVSRITLESPLGMGLDENAMEELKVWRFGPATKDGQPVAVEMRIEISFRLN
jgi:TonB family protein